MVEETVPGPVDFVLIEFPNGASTSSTAEALTELVDSGVIRLYDIVLIRTAGDGRSDRVDLATPLNGASSGLEALAGAQSGLFDDQDVSQAGAVLEPDTTALLIAYENAWAIPFVAAAHSAGGQLVASERIPAAVLIDVLEAAESLS
jgi:hypothetical protein